MLMVLPFALVLFVFVPGSDDRTRVEQIVENVRHNEALFDDIEVIWQFNYRKLSPKRPIAEMVVSSDAQGRSISQSGLFLIDIKGENLDHDGMKRSINRLRGFDGETTRLVDRKELANVIRGRAEDSQMLIPHRIPFRREFLMVPLSVYLQGVEAIKAHPSGRVDSGVLMKVSYGGEEHVDGLICHKLSIQRFRETQDGPVQTGETSVCLAQERNYLPVKTHGYNFRASRDVPISECILSDLREIEPGVWFPFRAVLTVYDGVSLVEDNAQVAAWMDEYEIKSVSLHPSYEISLFRDIKIPNGVPVYEVEHAKDGNKIVRAALAGPSDLPPGTALPGDLSQKRVLFWTPVSIAVSFAVGVGAFLVFLRRSLRLRAQPSGLMPSGEERPRTGSGLQQERNNDGENR